MTRLLLPTLLALSVSTALAQAGPNRPAVDPWALCPAEDSIPAFVEAPATGWPDRATSPTRVLADLLDYSAEDTTVLEGNVEMQRGDQWLGTDRLTLEQASQRYRAEGNVRFQDSAMRFTARELRGDNLADRIEVDALRYQLIAERGNGEAERAVSIGAASTLHSATYSTCDPAQRAWHLHARQVDIDHDEGLARVRGARLRMGEFTVGYLPYLVVPVDDRRRSGVLYPTFGRSTRNGYELAVPYYLNLAPHYDATITPRLLTLRGVMLNGEFRYLAPGGDGQLDLDYLNSDRVAGRDRHQVRYRHANRINRTWSLDIQGHRVSDDRFLEDFGEGLGDFGVSQIQSYASLRGAGRYWRSDFRVAGWQLTDPLLGPANQGYSLLPRLAVGWDRPWANGLQTGLGGDLARFTHPVLIGANRIDIRPWVRAPIEGSWWFLRPELAWRYTRWDLEGGGPGRQPSRSLPIASLDTGAFFERPVTFNGGAYVQTLEPRLYYLRVPYRDQRDIPVFDTAELTFGYAQLFRTNAYTGADRQSDANQATFALTSRLLGDADGRERLAGSIGQIRYFTPPRVGPGAVELAPRSKSAYVADVEFRPGTRTSLAMSEQWDPETRQTLLRSWRTQYRLRDDGVLNLAYRYRPEMVKQAAASFVYPLAPQWRLMGSWNYSFLDRSTLEAFGGLQWESCCMAVRVLGRHYLRNREGEKDNALYLEIELKGLGSFGRETERLLQDGILDYVR